MDTKSVNLESNKISNWKQLETEKGKTMKKAMMVLVGLLAFATTSQAAKYSWGVSGGISGASWEAGDVVYLVWDASGNGIGHLTLADLAAGKAVIGDDVIAKSGLALDGTLTKTSASITIDPGDVFAGQTTITVSPFTTFNNLYTVVFNDADITKATMVAVSQVGVSFTVNNQNVSTKSLASSTYTTYTPVPEPTAMALALVGFGVIALRRRFQKKAKT